MARRLLLLSALTALALSWRASQALTIPANIWIRQGPPTISMPPDRNGYYVGRGWNHMRYNDSAGKFILLDGYEEPPVYPVGSIFANSLWLYDPVENHLALEKVINWTMMNGPSEPLPENSTDPTPYDRHVYSCFVYSASKNSAYLWTGANRTIVGNSIGDVWAYDFSVHAWHELTAPHPLTVYEQACSYDPFLEKMILFGGNDREYGAGIKTYTLDLNTETWTDMAPPSSPPPRGGQNMVFDPVRRLTWMFSGAPFQHFSNELWTYDAVANEWAQVPMQGPWPSPRNFPHFARDSRHDVLLLWGGIDSTGDLTDTWVFRPETRQWEQIFPAASPEVPIRYYSKDLDYDPVNDFFVLNLGGVFWLYRYEDAYASVEPEGGSGLAFRITSSSPSSGGVRLTFSLPRQQVVAAGIFGVSGARVKTLATGRWPRGTHSLQWDGITSGGHPAPSGLYFARLETGGRAITRKFTLLR